MRTRDALAIGHALGRIERTLDAWEESKHKRAANGQFTSGGGGGSTASSKPKVTSQNGTNHVWIQTTKKDGSWGKPQSFSMEKGEKPEDTMKRLQKLNPKMKFKFSESEGEHFRGFGSAKGSSSSGSKSGVTEHKVTRKPNKNSAFELGTLKVGGKDIKYQVKAYETGSQFGIDGGSVSKLSAQGPDGQPLFEYDRGWIKKPQTKEAKQALEYLKKQYNNRGERDE